MKLRCSVQAPLETAEHVLGDARLLGRSASEVARWRVAERRVCALLDRHEAHAHADLVTTLRFFVMMRLHLGMDEPRHFSLLIAQHAASLRLRKVRAKMLHGLFREAIKKLCMRL